MTLEGPSVSAKMRMVGGWEAEAAVAGAGADCRHSCCMTAMSLDSGGRIPLGKRLVPKSIYWVRMHGSNGKLMGAPMDPAKVDD